MKLLLRKKPSMLVNFVIILLLILGFFSNYPVYGGVAEQSSSWSVWSDGRLALIQGSLIRLSTFAGEKVAFPLNIEHPVETYRYTWVVINAPAHGVVYIEPRGAFATGVYIPFEEYSGSDHFAISVNDEDGNYGRIGVAVEIHPAPAPTGFIPMEGTARTSLREISRMINNQELLTGSIDLVHNQGSFMQNEVVVSRGEQGEYASTEGGTLISENEFLGASAPPISLETDLVGEIVPEFTADSVILADIPAFTWVFGSAAVSAAMIAGYYDRTGFSNIYTGPTNGGVVPLTDTLWGAWMDGAGVTYPNNPLAASKNGVDGRTTRGSIDDYWVQFVSNEPDPYLTNGWMEHSWGDAVGDYMYTSQSAWGNLDGKTTFHGNSGSPLPLTCDEIETENFEADGTLGIRQFFEARGYEVGDCFFQYTDNLYAGGFSLDQYKAEIDAGFPVMIHLGDHTLVGIGYEPGTNTIYIHDAWIRNANTMEWGNSYQNKPMVAVSIVHPSLGLMPEIEVAPQTDEVWGIGVMPLAEVTLTIGSYSTSRIASTGGEVYFDLGGTFDIVPGNVISINDGIVSAAYTAAELSITKVRVNDNKVWGTAAYNVSPIWVYACNETNCVRDDAWTTSSSNSWLADFNDIPYDLANGDLVIAVQPDEAGNRTVVTWRLSDPYMIVDPVEDIVYVVDWFVEELDDLLFSHPLELRINGTLVDTRLTDAEMNCVFPNIPVDIVAGQRLEARGDYKIIEHVVEFLKIKSIDPVTDTVKGKASVGKMVNIVASDPENDTSVQVSVKTGADGAWLADLTGKVDITPGTVIDAYVFDMAGNATWMSAHTPSPAFSIDATLDRVSGWDWLPGKTATVTVGAFQRSIEVDSFGNFSVSLAGLFDFQAGQAVIVSDGITTKTHTIRTLSIIDINDIDDWIAGNADPDSMVKVVAFDLVSNGTVLSVQTDGAGDWQADFAGLEDLAQRSWGWVEQADEDGDLTEISFSLPDYPVLNELGRAYGIAGQPAMSVNIYGENFAPTSRVRWSEVQLETTYINQNVLSVIISESDLAEPGIFTMDVYTPPPGGGTSTSARFRVIGVTPQYESQLGSNYVDFAWDGIDGASQYKIQFSSMKDFSVLLVNTKSASPAFTAYDVPLVRGKTYYWRIRPFYGSLKGPWSSVMPFQSLDPLPAPDLGITDIAGYEAIVSWSQVDGAVKYKLQVSKDAAFTKLIFNAPVFSPETSKSLSLPEKARTYYWRVRAIDEVKIKSGWSENGSFSVPVD